EPAWWLVTTMTHRLDTSGPRHSEPPPTSHACSGTGPAAYKSCRQWHNTKSSARRRQGPVPAAGTVCRLLSRLVSSGEMISTLRILPRRRGHDGDISQRGVATSVIP